MEPDALHVWGAFVSLDHAPLIMPKFGIHKYIVIHYCHDSTHAVGQNQFLTVQFIYMEYSDRKLIIFPLNPQFFSLETTFGLYMYMLLMHHISFLSKL